MQNKDTKTRSAIAKTGCLRVVIRGSSVLEKRRMVCLTGVCNIELLVFMSVFLIQRKDTKNSDTIAKMVNLWSIYFILIIRRRPLSRLCNREDYET